MVPDDLRNLQIIDAVTTAGCCAGRVALHTMYHFLRKVIRHTTEGRQGGADGSFYDATSIVVFVLTRALLGMLAS